VRALANRSEGQLCARLANGAGGFIERCAVYGHKQCDWLTAFRKQRLWLARDNLAKLAGLSPQFIGSELFHMRTLAFVRA